MTNRRSLADKTGRYPWQYECSCGNIERLRDNHGEEFECVKCDGSMKLSHTSYGPWTDEEQLEMDKEPPA